MKWSDIISKETMKLAMTLGEQILQERNVGKIIYPPQDQIFRALELTPPDRVKVCIIGQDPYHSTGVANGLAFSVQPGASLQPSLRNIFKEYRDDLGLPQPPNGDLAPWAKEGVLLLNTTLTVEAHKPNSHSNMGWQVFTGEIVKTCTQLSQPIVFLAWGRDAQKLVHSYLPIADQRWLMRNYKKTCLESSHPSPFSASRASSNNPAFLGSKPFSFANKSLEEMGAEPVDWRL